MRAPSTATIQMVEIFNDDGTLILEIQRDPTRFNLIYERWAVRIYQYFFHRTGEPDSAEDLTTQLFLTAFRALPRYRHAGHFAAWLFTLAHHLLKRHDRRRQHEAPLELARSLITRSGPPGKYAQVDEIERLRTLIQALTDENQELIRLRYVAGLSTADTARVLNQREDAVKKALDRVLARLRGVLEQNQTSPNPLSMEDTLRAATRVPQPRAASLARLRARLATLPPGPLPWGERLREMLRQPGWAIALVVLVLAAGLLVAGPRRVLSALQSLVDNIPRVGLVDLSRSLGGLAGSANVERVGTSITITPTLLSADPAPAIGKIPPIWDDISPDHQRQRVGYAWSRTWLTSDMEPGSGGEHG